MWKRKKKKIASLKPMIPYILTSIPIITSHLLFQNNDLLILATFIILIPLFAILKFDGRIPVAYAIALLIIAAFILAFQKSEDLANQIAIYSYWLLVVGVTCLTIDYFREQRRAKK